MSINVLPSPPSVTDLKYVVVGVPSVPAFSGSAGTVTVNHNQGRTPIGYSNDIQDSYCKDWLTQKEIEARK